MNPENPFEKEGLKIDKERVLTYSQLSCPLDCIYCFVEDVNSNQKKDVAYLSVKQFELLSQLPKDVSMILLGCDTEFFQSKKGSLEILHKLCDLEKDISVVTKIPLSDGFIDDLSEINSKMEKRGNLFAFSVSIPCLESVKEWEPKTPDPILRVKTLAKVHNLGIKTMVAMRPLLPTVQNEELRRIIDVTKDFSDGYYSGPLYLKELDGSVIPKETLDALYVEKVQPHWMPEGNLFFKIEKKGQMDFLGTVVKENRKMFFEGAAEGIKHLKKERDEKY